jgi:hypothetical protein
MDLQIYRSACPDEWISFSPSPKRATLKILNAMSIRFEGVLSISGSQVEIREFMATLRMRPAKLMPLAISDAIVGNVSAPPTTNVLPIT